MLIYIRHGHDKPSSHHKYDERLSSKGKQEARRVAQELISQYGIPTHIYYSPLYRTKKTAEEFLAVATEECAKQLHNAHKAHKVPLLIAEPRLGRYFTRHQRKALALGKTQLHKESKNVLLDQGGKVDFYKRIEDQYQQVQSQSKVDKSAVIWNVTHALVIKKIDKINQSSKHDLKKKRTPNSIVNKHIPYLGILKTG
jgi:broad specificity phosphatase PhoE